MQPTFNTTGDLLLTEYLSPRFKRVKSGDVVVATKPTDPRMSILKRVRGMPGEKIYVQTGRNRPPEWLTVPDDHVWLEGDNPRQSSDSRDYGPVPICLVRGKVWARFWPISQAGWVESRVIDHSLTAGERVFGGLKVVIDDDASTAAAKAEDNASTCDEHCRKDVDE